MDWILKEFDELTIDELYEMLRLRSEVFIVEQDCVYQDLDNNDQRCWHLFGRDADGKLCAYLRIVPLGVQSDEYGSIGRVVIAAHTRGSGLGEELMRRGIELYDLLIGPDVPLRIHAQSYLLNFYSRFGFQPISPSHEFEGRPHTWMQRLPQ